MVGVGLPVYNGARFIGQTLDALLGQSLSDFEVIISDNASTDETPAICAAYAARDSRIRFLRQPRNLGLPWNWNFVFQQSRGRYFKWAAANDIFSNNLLERCVELLQAEPSVVLAFGTTWLLEAEGVDARKYRGAFEVTDESPAVRYHEICSRLGLNSPVSGVVRRQALKNTGLIRPYPGSDVVLMAELALQGKFRIIGDADFFRRVDPMSLSSNRTTAELWRLHDPAATGSEPIVARMHADLLMATLRTRGVPLGGRVAATYSALRNAIAVRGEIFGEIAGMFGSWWPSQKIDGPR